MGIHRRFTFFSSGLSHKPYLIRGPRRETKKGRFAVPFSNEPASSRILCFSSLANIGASVGALELSKVTLLIDFAKIPIRAKQKFRVTLFRFGNNDIGWTARASL